MGQYQKMGQYQTSRTAKILNFSSTVREGRKVLSLLTLSYNLSKLREKWRQNSISHCLSKKQIFLKVKMTLIFRENKLDIII